MPISEITKGRKGGISDALDYDMREGNYLDKNNEKPEVVLFNSLVPDTAKEMAKQFNQTYKMNRYPKNDLKKPYERIVISFSKTESQNLPKESQIKAVDGILDKYFEKNGTQKENYQFVAIQHTDKEHTHYHVTINRAGFDGKTLDDGKNHYKIMKASAEIEKEMGLERVKNRPIDYERKTIDYNVQEKPNTKARVMSALRDKIPSKQQDKTHIAMSAAESFKNSKSIEQFKTLMARKGVETNYKENAKGQASISFKYNNLSVKGTAIGIKGNLLRDKYLAIEKENEAKKERNQGRGFGR